MSSPTPSLHRKSSLVDYISSIPKRTRLPSLRSRKSTASLDSKSNKRDSSYVSYSVYQQSMAPIILRDPDATQKMLEAILDSPGGRRALARLARTCKAFKDPSLDLLWKDLDTFVPLLTLFPNGLMKRARRPALGLAKDPEAGDWEKVLAYGKRVRSITYVEAFNSVSPTIFPVFQQCPEEYLLPNLTSLTWKAETAPGLNYSKPFLNTGLRSLTLEMGVRAPKINEFLDEVMSRTHLSSFSFTLHSNLPENFVEKAQKNSKLEKLALMAPGSLAARVGSWISSLPLLKSLQLDLTNSSTRAVDGFFSDMNTGSGSSTPDSVGGTDSGVFSGDEFDFSEIRKSVVRLTSDGFRHGPFRRLTQLSLIGEASNVATFLKHITSPLTQLDLAIEDPPARDEWKDLCSLLADHFGGTLQTLRISATSSSRFSELVRSTSRGGDIQLQHLTLEHFGPLPCLSRFEIELPESAIFYNADLVHLARVCPNLEVVRLCGQARFPQAFGSPALTLEGIIPLTSGCKRLHTLSAVVNALDGSDKIFRNIAVSSRALMRLNVGHSWIRDPLQTAILLSHIAPHLEILRWFAQASRSGVIDTHAAAWQKVQDYLPSLQELRLVERSLIPKPVVIERPRTVEKGIDATVRMTNRSVQASPKCVDTAVEAFVETVNIAIEVAPETTSVEVDAVPQYADYGVMVAPEVVEISIDAVPQFEDRGTDVLELEDDSAASDTSEASPSTAHANIAPLFPSFMPTLHGIVTFPVRAVRVYTYYMTLPLRYVFSFAPAVLSTTQAIPKGLTPASPTDEDISEKRMSHADRSNDTSTVNIMNGAESSMPYENGTHENGAHENGMLAEISPVCQ